MILYFRFSQAAGEFVHDDYTAQHMHATLQLDHSDESVIHYSFNSDVGVGALNGRKITQAPDFNHD